MKKFPVNAFHIVKVIFGFRGFIKRTRKDARKTVPMITRKPK